MAHPAASSSQPAQIPALDNQQHAQAHTDKAPKEKKGQGKPANNTSEFPLEVRVLFFDLTKLDQLIYTETLEYIASTKTCIL